ncbi:hypothetical protein [Thaumasiovibrio subtropicus]|uniref:hypothetical protein n=1 Tax=Thaumasiovibrio subtropicus TaxID=1891207 RepID=UPI000B3648B1|nr:hypothetical protein [Thaumasiovibrio subtropicus]
MISITEWLESKSNLQPALEGWLIATPKAIFDAPLTPLKQQAIGQWYMACMTCYRSNKSEPKQAASWIQLAYSYLQVMASDQSHTHEVRLWCLQRLDHLIVALLECAQHSGENTEEAISAHIAFMSSQQHRNLPADLQAP